MFDISNIALSIGDYPISYIELTGTLFGLISVYLAAKANIFTWPTGIVNEIAFFALFYQVQLYSDMFLQVFFFATTIYGWYHWNRVKQTKSVSKINSMTRVIHVTVIIISTVLLGMLMTHIHEILPTYFRQPASYPFADSFTTVTSIVASVLLAQKKIETWLLWIVVDIVCIVLYFKKEIPVVAIEYIIFLILCLFGFRSWSKKLNNG